MPVSLASSPRWFQSISMLLCDGVKCFRLSIDDIMFFGERTGHVRDLETNLEWLLSLI